MPHRRVVHQTPDPDARTHGPATGEVYGPPHDADDGHGAFERLVAVRPSAYTQLREALAGMFDGGQPPEQTSMGSSVDAVLATQTRDVTIMVLDRMGAVQSVTGGHVAGRDTSGWVGKHYSHILGASTRVTGPIQDALAGRASCVNLPAALVGPAVAKPGTMVTSMCIPRQDGAHRVAAGAVILLLSVLAAM